jgi:hypothetical protein
MVETQDALGLLICLGASVETLEREQQRPNDERDTEFRYEIVHCGLLDGGIVEQRAKNGREGRCGFPKRRLNSRNNSKNSYQFSKESEKYEKNAGRPMSCDTNEVYNQKVEKSSQNAKWRNVCTQVKSESIFRGRLWHKTHPNPRLMSVRPSGVDRAWEIPSEHKRQIVVSRSPFIPHSHSRTTTFSSPPNPRTSYFRPPSRRNSWLAPR